MKCGIKGVFVRFFRRYIGDINVKGHVVNHHRGDSSLDFIGSSIYNYFVNLLPGGSTRILVELPSGDLRLFAKAASLNAWTQVWP